MHEKARMAADIAPDAPIVLTVLGIALTISREFQAAQIVIEKALALDPTQLGHGTAVRFFTPTSMSLIPRLINSRRLCASAHSTRRLS